MNITEDIKKNFEEEYNNLVKAASRKLGAFWAEDCVMDCYERLLRRATTLRLTGDIKYLMRGILNNRIKDYMRQHIDMVEVEEFHIYGDEVEDSLVMSAAYDDVVDRIEQMEGVKKDAISLYFLEGIKTTSLSKVVGVEVRTLNNWVNDFRRTF